MHCNKFALHSTRHELRKNRGMCLHRASISNKVKRLSFAYCVASASLALAACSTIETTGNVIKAGASVAGTAVTTTASVAATSAELGLKTASTVATVGSTVASAGSAAVSAGAAAKTATAATAAVAVAGASVAVSAVKWGMEFSRDNDIQYASLITDGGDRFSSGEGARITTQDCSDARVGEPALLVTRRSGEFYVRTNGRECLVLSINDAKSK
jgi:hypothetical protein